MSAFNLDKLLSDMFAMHAVGVAEVLGLCTAIPAFLAAANPGSSGLHPNRRIATIVAVTVAALILQLFISNPMIWLPVFGVVFGLMIRWFPWVRTNWIVLSLCTAVALGVIQFSGLQYSNNQCWP